MQLEPAGLNAIYFNAIDQICHNFIRFHPPKPQWVSDADFELFSGVVEATYRFHDLMLGYVMHLAGPDSVVILVSDHGFHCDHRRVPEVSELGGAEVEVRIEFVNHRFVAQHGKEADHEGCEKING